MPRVSLEKRLEFIGRLAADFKPYAEILRTYADFIAFEEPLIGELKSAAPSVAKNEAKRLADSGKPLLKAEGVTIDLTWAAAHAAGIAAHFAMKKPDAWKPLAEDLKKGGAWAADSLAGFLADDVDAVKNSMPASSPGIALYISLLQLALKPLLLSLAAALGSAVARDGWKKGFCPVCGAFPCMSEKSAPGKPWTLFCPNCETAYSYPYPRCPFCENADTGKVNLIGIKNSPLSIVACTHCTGYIKLADRSIRPDFPQFPFSEILTLELDIIAAKHGYSKLSSGVFGI